MNRIIYNKGAFSLNTFTRKDGVKIYQFNVSQFYTTMNEEQFIEFIRRCVKEIGDEETQAKIP